MNVLDLSDLLNELPDDMIVSAYKKLLSPQIAEGTASAFYPVSDQIVPQKSTEPPVKHPPRWITAAALAACMLFAVGVGAFLLRGQHEDLTMQSSLVDSSVQTLTTTFSETSVKNETLTQTNTSVTAANVVDVETVPVIGTNESLVATTPNVQPQKTEKMTTIVQSVTQTTETTSIPETITTTIFQGDFSSKVNSTIIEAVRAGEVQIPVYLMYKISYAGLSDAAKEAGRQYAETLDPDIYSAEERDQLEWDYYMKTQEKLYSEARNAKTVSILKAIGANPAEAICYPNSPRISCTLTPEQIERADVNEEIRSVIMGYAWKVPSGITEPEGTITDPETVRAMFTQLFTENNLDARCTENTTYSNGQIAVTLEWNSDSGILVNYIIQDFATKYRIDQYSYRIVAVVNGHRNESADV